MSDTQRSVIESLSVELWREIFDNLPSTALWYSFRGLNRKIDAIIDQTPLYLNFQKQGNYGYFIKYILPSIDVNSIRSLKLQKGKQTKLFFTIYPLNSLAKLRILSLDFMYSLNDNSFQFWYQLSSLKYLQSLNIIFWSMAHRSNSVEEKGFIIRSIFNKGFCPLLKVFIIDTSGEQRGEPTIPLLIPTTKTTNIEYLSIDLLTFEDFIKLIPALQNVKSCHIHYSLPCDNKSNEQQQEITVPRPLMPNCVQLHLKLSDEITFEHIEYILKHTLNLKDLFLWGWEHLLDAKRWEILLSIQCPKLLKLEFVCTGYIGDEDFDQAGDDFEQECATTPFWIERNATISFDEDFSVHDYRSDAVVRFNLKKTKQPTG